MTQNTTCVAPRKRREKPGTVDPDSLFDEFKQRGASFVKELSFLAFFRTRNEYCR